MPEPCPHIHTTRIGRAEAKVTDADTAIAGLSAHVTISTCTGCGELVASTSLWRGIQMVLAGESRTVLGRPVGGGGSDG